MARKPLIDPNALNQGGSTPLSTISRIVQRDREQSGRSNPPEETPETQVTSDPANQLTGEQGNSLTSEPDNAPAQREVETPQPKPPEPAKAAEAEAPKPKAKKESSPKAEARRLAAEERVEQMGKSPMKQIGPRIPAEWDEWLEDYVYARRKTGLQKQDIIRGIVREFIVREIAREDEEA